MAVPPLNPFVRITDEKGQPTPDFMQWWTAQRAANDIIVPLANIAEVSRVFDLLGDTHGDLLFRGASVWGTLGPGTAGFVLATGGPAAAPVWVTLDKAFTDLTDTPSVYTGAAGQAAVVNAGETALEFADLTTAFLALTDTPSVYTGAAGQAAVVNTGETALEFADLTTAFTALTDTPSVYTGQGGRIVAVNAGATALEFAASVGDASFLLAFQTYLTNTTLTYSTTAFATKGNIIRADRDTLDIYAVRTFLDDGQTVRLVIAATATTTPFAITSILYSSPTVTPTAATEDVRFILPAPIRLNTGDHIAILFVRTDGTPTSDLRVPFTGSLTDDNGNFTMLRASRYASVAPQVGDNTLVVSADRVRMLIESIDPALANVFAFTGLPDTPSTYTGQGGKIVAVNAGATALEFITPRAPNFTVAGLPSAATSGAGAIAYVSNETGGAVQAFSDGTNWRRCTDRAVVS